MDIFLLAHNTSLDSYINLPYFIPNKVDTCASKQIPSKLEFLKAKSRASRLPRDSRESHHQDLCPEHKVEQPSHCTQPTSLTVAERSAARKKII